MLQFLIEIGAIIFPWQQTQKTNVLEFHFFFFSVVRQRKVRAKQEKYMRMRCVKTVYDVTETELAAQFCLKWVKVLWLAFRYVL